MVREQADPGEIRAGDALVERGSPDDLWGSVNLNPGNTKYVNQSIAEVFLRITNMG